MMGFIKKCLPIFFLVSCTEIGAEQFEIGDCIVLSDRWEQYNLPLEKKECFIPMEEREEWELEETGCEFELSHPHMTFFIIRVKGKKAYKVDLVTARGAIGTMNIKYATSSLIFEKINCKILISP